MTNRMAIDADEPTTLAECEAGLFLFGDCIGLKTEYGTEADGVWWPEAFVVASGEYFWGGASNHADRDNLVVTPISASPYARKISPDQHRAAMVALQNSKWPFMPADQRSEIVDIVIAAFGLEKAE